MMELDSFTIKSFVYVTTEKVSLVSKYNPFIEYLDFTTCIGQCEVVLLIRLNVTRHVNVYPKHSLQPNQEDENDINIY